MPASEHVLQDYQTTRLSLKDHPVRFLRPYYQDYGIQTTQAAINQPNGQRVQTAGIVLIRQKPGSANGVFFITLEDETGIANLIVWPRIGALYRPVLMGARIMLVNGRVQTADNVTHIVVDQLIDRTGDLQLLSETAQVNHLEKGDVHTGLDQTTRLQTSTIPIHAPKHAAASSQQPMQDLRKHPRNIRIIPKSRDFH
ncbi:MAG: Error-prone DNA polymerase [Hyphomonas sp. TMED17]|nr:MAG: Error-prone DNA polymerase [Hyphomonas sp. TMED17]